MTTRLARLESKVFDRDDTLRSLQETVGRHGDWISGQNERWDEQRRTNQRIETKLDKADETNVVLSRAVEKMAAIQEMNERRLEGLERGERDRMRTTQADLKKLVWWFLGIVAALVVGYVTAKATGK